MVPPIVRTTISDEFETQARRTPGAIALVHPGPGPARRVTYAELSRRSDAIAGRLVVAGVRPGDRVGVMMRRSPELIVAMLGAVKAGAAYVPLDPAYPDERLRFLLQDTSAAACLTDDATGDRAAALGATAVAVPSADDAPGHGRPEASGGPDQPAYVMYTSGSTGLPKGVVVPHRAILRLVKGQSYARLDATRVTLQLAPPSFDASTFEIWGALLNGGCCVLATDEGVPDLPRLRETIVQHGVTTLWLTASLFNAIVDHAPDVLASVEEVLTGGEALSVPHVRRAQELLPRTQLINGYGPTESTTFACCHRIPSPAPAEWVSVPIGTPLAGTTAHVLDAALQPVRAGEPGHLYLGGEGLALEYLNNPALTAERFPVSPGLGRLYRTGDRARQLPDGTLDYLGRDDDQVKLRGYRIEPGEVEAALRSVAGVSDAVVTVREDQPGDRRLVGYFTASDCVAGPSPDALRAHLSGRLPEYMVPSVFVQVDAIPLTPNGKADRRALPVPSRARPALDRAPVAARTPLEEWLAGLWRDVLRLDEVGVHDRFFDLGGTSLAAMRFLARLNERSGRPLPALVLFRAPTIAGLAGVLASEFGDALPDGLGDHVSERGPASLTDRATQRRDELAERRMRRRRAN